VNKGGLSRVKTFSKPRCNTQSVLYSSYRFWKKHSVHMRNEHLILRYCTAVGTGTSPGRLNLGPGTSKWNQNRPLDHMDVSKNSPNEFIKNTVSVYVTFAQMRRSSLGIHTIFYAFFPQSKMKRQPGICGCFKTQKMSVSKQYYKKYNKCCPDFRYKYFRPITSSPKWAAREYPSLLASSLVTRRDGVEGAGIPFTSKFDLAASSKYE